MDSLGRNRLCRLLTVMATPSDSPGKVNYQQAEELVLALLDSGNDDAVISESCRF